MNAHVFEGPYGRYGDILLHGEAALKDELYVFYAPKLRKWVVRVISHGLRDGDYLQHDKPSEDELHERWPGYEIRWHYSV